MSQTDFEQGDVEPTIEQFLAAGEAGNVLEADAAAWAAMESVLGRDPIKAWRLVSINHGYEGPGKIGWTAVFQRNQEVETPPNVPVGYQFDANSGDEITNE